MGTSRNVAVVGGGISGLGIAHALALRGHSVSLFEKEGTLATRTSANSLRIIHGGFRYLQQAALLRIIDSIRDQNYCLRRFPRTMRELRCFMPLSAFGVKSAFPVACAATIYRMFLRALSSPLPVPRIRAREDAQRLFPWCREIFAHGALEWYDAQFLAHHMIVETLAEEIRRADGIIHLDAAAQIGEEEESAVVTANGIDRRFDFCVDARGHRLASAAFRNGLSLAFNMVFPESFELPAALGFTSREGRLFFLVPRPEDSEIALGTGYVPYHDSLRITAPDLNDFIDEAKRSLPMLPLSIFDLKRVESGVVPTARKGSLVIRGRTEIKKSGPVISVLASKYTTFHSVGERVRAIIERP